MSLVVKSALALMTDSCRCNSRKNAHDPLWGTFCIRLDRGGEGRVGAVRSPPRKCLGDAQFCPHAWQPERGRDTPDQAHGSPG